MVEALERVALLVYHVTFLQYDISMPADHHHGFDVSINHWGVDLLWQALQTREQIIHPAFLSINIPTNVVGIETNVKVTHQFQIHLVQGLVMNAQTARSGVTIYENMYFEISILSMCALASSVIIYRLYGSNL